MKISESLSEVGRPVVYYPSIAVAVGGVKAGILLCQLIWWTNKQHDEEGWIYKSQEELTAETGMSAEEQLSARKKLRSLGVLEEKNKRLEHRLYYRVDVEKLNQLWDQLHSSPMAVSPIPETEKAGFGKPETPDSSKPDMPDSSNIHRVPESTVHTPPVSPEKPVEEKGKNHKTKNPNGPDPRIRQFSDKWCEVYNEVLDGKYAYNGSRDTDGIKRLLSTFVDVDVGAMTIAELVGLAANAWRKPTLFYCKQAITIHGFANKINEIRQELRTGGDPMARLSPRDRLAALDELIEKSPSNRSSAAHRPSLDTEAERAKLADLRDKRKRLVSEIAGAGK